MFFPFSVIFLSLIVFRPAFALEVEDHRVYDVFVEIPYAQGQEDPRTQALSQACVFAFQALTAKNQRIISSAQPDASALLRKIKKISFQDEKISPTKYQAIFDLTFDPSIREYWQSPPVVGEKKGPSFFRPEGDTEKKPVFQEKYFIFQGSFNRWTALKTVLLQHYPRMVFPPTQLNAQGGTLPFRGVFIEAEVEALLKQSGFQIFQKNEHNWHIRALH